jgi:YVTN family beta-propeller protein
VGIGVGANPDAVAVNTATGMIYVTNESDGTVSVINGVTATVTKTIQVGSDPRGIAVDEATGNVYVTNSGDGTVSVINGNASAVTATITVGAGTDAVAVDDKTGQVFVSWHDGIATISAVTNTVTQQTSTTPDNPIMGTGISDVMAVDPGTGRLYRVGFGAADLVQVIDVATGQWVASYQDPGLNPDTVAIDPAHEVLYAGDCQATYPGGMFAVDLKTGLVTTQLNTGCPAAVAVDPATGTAYSVDGNTDPQSDPRSGLLSVVQGAHGVLAASIPAGTAPSAMAVDPVTGTIYVADDTVSGTVTAITTAASVITSAASATFTVGAKGTFSVTATGYPQKASFTESGRLPKGVSFAAAGVLQGTPAAGAGGLYRFTISASNGIGAPASQQFTLAVHQAPAIVSPRSATFTHGYKSTFTVRATGYPKASITEKGTLPRGVTFRAYSNGTAVLSGTPARSAAGHKFVIRLTATNKVGSPAVQVFTLSVR